MTKGGIRKGAGRKKKEPTKHVRIPITGANAARGIVDYFINKAKDRLESSTWFKYCPDELKAGVILKLIGLQTRERVVGNDYTEDIDVLACVATEVKTGEKFEFYVVMDPF